MPESSRDEIAKLEALYANNPGGRVFTHLAEAYRKAGELDRARTILEDGIARHSDYASAQVVLGRVLLDLGESDDATAAFSRVLELDPENRVAIRALGDLAHAGGRNQDALKHYRQLLSLDPTDEQLRRRVDELNYAPVAVEPVAEASSAADVPVSNDSPESEAEASDSGVESFESVVEPSWSATESSASEPDSHATAGESWASAAESPTADEAMSAFADETSTPGADTPAEYIDIAADTTEPAPEQTVTSDFSLGWNTADDEESSDLPGDLAHLLGAPEESVRFDTPLYDEDPAAAGFTEQLDSEYGSTLPIDLGPSEEAAVEDAGDFQVDLTASSESSQPGESESAESGESEPAQSEPAEAEPGPESQPWDETPESGSWQPTDESQRWESSDESKPWESSDKSKPWESTDEPDTWDSAGEPETWDSAGESIAEQPESATEATEVVDEASDWIVGDDAIFDAVSRAEPAQSAEPAEQPSVASESSAEPSFEALLSSSRNADYDDDEPQPTETLAELYRAQGFDDQAAAVYRALLIQRPGDARLLQRLAELEARGAIASGEIGEAGAADDEPADIESAWINSSSSDDATPSPFSWTEEAGVDVGAGPSIGEYFTNLLAWKPANGATAASTGNLTPAEPETPDAEQSAAPAFPEAIPLTTDLLTVETDPWDMPAAPTAGADAPDATGAGSGSSGDTAPASAAESRSEEKPVVPSPKYDAAPAWTPSPNASPVDAAFDEWFTAGPSAPPAPAPEPVAADPQPAPVEEAAPAAQAQTAADSSEDEADDDLEMFRSWLQSLKR